MVVLITIALLYSPLQRRGAIDSPAEPVIAIAPDTKRSDQILEAKPCRTSPSLSLSGC